MTGMPEDCHLAYVVSHEAWYARQPGIVDQRHIMVMASSSGGGCAWEFSVTEHDFGSHGRAIKVGVFDDAFAAFAQIPEFYAALVAEKVETLDETRALLDRMGAVDETERTPRGTPEPSGVVRPPTWEIGRVLRAAAVASYSDSSGRRVLVIPESAVPAIAEAAQET
jgi:hypothetical protein